MIIGMTLLLFSIAAFAYQGISSKSTLKIVDSEPTLTMAEKPEGFPLFQNIGTISLVGGIAFVVVWFAKN